MDSHRWTKILLTGGRKQAEISVWLLYVFIPAENYSSPVHEDIRTVICAEITWSYADFLTGVEGAFCVAESWL